MRKLHEVNHYEGVELSKERIFVYAKKKTALQEFISAISKRFSEFCDEPAGVVTATRIADMKAWPISWDALKDTVFTSSFVSFGCIANSMK